MKIVVDTDRCVGAGQCVLMEPAVFDQNEVDGTVILLVTEPDDNQLDMVRRAVRTCPSEALSLPESRTPSTATNQESSCPVSRRPR